jgi:ElaB/YqjD/DUF883 family membrane-anchored ribosome-binding protein
MAPRPSKPAAPAARGGGRICPPATIQPEKHMETKSRPTPAFPSASSSGDGAIGRAASSLNGAVDRLADDTTRGMAPAIERAALLAHQAVNSVAGAAGPTADWLGAQGELLAAKRRQVAADSGQYVSAHPWTFLGVALAAGFLISRLMR